jgi:hypothetical protein
MAAALAWGCGARGARAQGPVDAGLRGRVVGADGRGVAGVEVRVRAVEGVAADGGRADASNLAGLRERVTTTRRDGSFLVLRLLPGEYIVSAKTESERVEVAAGELAEVMLRPDAGGLTARVRKSGSGAPSAAGSSEISVEGGKGEDYTRSRTAELPLSDLGWEDVATLDSRANVGVNDAVETGEGAEDGAARDAGAGAAQGRAQSSDGSAAQGLSFGGLAATQNSVTVDGLSAQQNFGSGARGATVGGPHAGATFGEGAVASFRVLPQTFSAQYGGAAGGVVAVVSRAGPERLHGSAFVLARQSAWAAANPFSVVTHYRDGAIANSLVKPDDARQQFGGALGFPLAAKILPRWMRGSGEGLQVFASDEEQFREGEIDSSPELANFYALTPAQLISLELRGVTAAATNAALDYLDSLTGSVARSATRNLGFARVDAGVSKRDHVTLAYIRNRFDAPAGAALGQASDAVVARGVGSLGESVVRIDAGTARWLHVFSTRLNHELRAQVARDLEFETPDAPLPQEPAIGPGGYAPQVTIAPNGFAYGTTASLGRTAYPDERRVQLADLLQVAVKGNLIAIGGDWSRIDDRVASFTNAEGSFLYDDATNAASTNDAGGLVDWITDYTLNVNAYPNGGCPRGTSLQPHYFCFHSFTQSFGQAQTEFVTHDVAGFAQDSVRLGDVEVTTGVRYEYTLLPLPQAPNYALDAALRGAFASAVPGLTETFPEDRNDVGPRLALAWSPRGGRVVTVEAGYGMFYGRVPGATVRAALANTALPATALSVRIRPTTETNCPQVTGTNQGFGYPCDFVATPPAAVEQTSSATVFAGRFRVPQVQRATLDVQRELGRHAWVQAGYAMALARQLPQSVDINIAPSTAVGQFVLQGGDGRAGVQSGQMLTLPLYTARRIAQYGPVTEIVSNANATYHAGTVEARWMGAGLEVRGGYTFSRAIDYGPQQGATPRTSGQLDPFADGYDKGLSSLNFAQRFAGDLRYEPKLERGARWVRKAVNGLRVTAIATAGSGAPYSYGVYGGSYLSGGSDSINGSGGAGYLPTVGRNTLRLPLRSDVDARLAREFRVRRVRGVGFVEAFNLLNAVNLTRVETRAFLVGTPATVNGRAGPTPVVFQDEATVAGEGLTTPAFGTPLSSTNGLSREREVELGLRLEF